MLDRKSDPAVPMMMNWIEAIEKIAAAPRH